MPSAPSSESKYQKLKELLKRMERAVIAFSGGADSAFLARAARDALGENAICVSVISGVLSARELADLRRTAQEIGTAHIEIPLDIFSVPNFGTNPSDRCYYCKKRIFELILDYAGKHGYNYVCDGTVCDDSDTDRPGMRALRELSISSPLKLCGIYKADIQGDKPSNSCLAARIPYGFAITREKLKQIETAEDALFDIGLKIFRVRHHGELARIEIAGGELPLIQEHRHKIYERLLDCGFKYVTVDILTYEEHRQCYLTH